MPISPLYAEHSSPATSAAAVTPNDDDALSATTRGLYVGTGGDVAVVMEDGQDVTFAGVPDGAILPIRVTKVKDTGTDASNIVALW